jgi:hypothetical protein
VQPSRLHKMLWLKEAGGTPAPQNRRRAETTYMPISWNEIRQNAIRFARDWAGARSESAEKQTFWNEFFEVFGIRRRTVAAFEEPVKKISGDYGYIDLFWPGTLLVEHKSFGKRSSKNNFVFSLHRPLTPCPDHSVVPAASGRGELLLNVRKRL